MPFSDVGKSTLLLPALVAVALLAFLASRHEARDRETILPPVEAEKEDTGQSPIRHPEADGLSAVAIETPDEPNQQEPQESAAHMSITQSVYESSPEFREMAIGAVEREMEQRRMQYPDGWLRWQPLRIDDSDITNGNYLDERNIAKSFSISPFPDQTYRATLTEYRPREATASATWLGVLDDGDSGTVKISIIAHENGADLVIRLRTPNGQFSITPTDVDEAYVSAETNAAFWSTQLANQ